MPDPGPDASKPHISRVHDYLLGGKDNFAADRAVADQIIAQLPAVQVGVRAQRDPCSAAWSGTWSARRACDSSSTSAPGCRPRRTFAQIRELFGGLELVEPGVVLVPDWRPDPGTQDVPHHPVLGLAAAGVASKA
jgi:hypothetical protein